MQCKLCQKDAPIRRSHVIPEFLWTRIYDSEHRTVTISADLSHVRILRKGLRERLLCEGCECRLKVYEDYFAELWYTHRPLPAEIPDTYNAFVTGGLDYAKFKLFHISILWRESVASGSEFVNIKLGSHERKLREMILSGDPGKEGVYPLWGAVLLRPGTQQRSTSLLGVLEPFRVDGRRVYSTMYGGCIWSIEVSSHSRRTTQPPALTEKGLLVLQTIDVGQMRAFREVFSQTIRLPRLKGRTLWHAG